MADELVDIFDDDMNHIGTAMKYEAREKALWHKIFFCWIIKYEENGNHKIWFQLRSKTKHVHPGLLDTSASGHLSADESDRAGVREIEEEIGLKVNPNKVVIYDTGKWVGERGGNKAKIILIKSFYVTEEDITSLKIQTSEVDGIFEAYLDDVINLFSHKTKQINISGITTTSDDKYITERRIVNRSAFSPYGDELYVQLFSKIKDYIKNEYIKTR